MHAVGYYRNITAREFMITLGTGLNLAKAVLDGKIYSLIIAKFKIGVVMRELSKVQNAEIYDTQLPPNSGHIKHSPLLD